MNRTCARCLTRLRKLIAQRLTPSPPGENLAPSIFSSAELTPLREQLLSSEREVTELRAELAEAQKSADVSTRELRACQQELADLRAADPSIGLDEDEPTPIALDLIALADRIAEYQPPDHATREDVLAALRWMASSTEQLMRTSCEVTSFVDESGSRDVTRHAVLATTPTSNPDLVGHIARTLQPGYMWRGKTLRPQMVVIYASESAE